MKFMTEERREWLGDRVYDFITEVWHPYCTFAGVVGLMLVAFIGGIIVAS